MWRCVLDSGAQDRIHCLSLLNILIDNLPTQQFLDESTNRKISSVSYLECKIYLEILCL
jgi:hypothetical protein